MMKKNELQKIFSLVLLLFFVGIGFVSTAQRQIVENPMNYKEKGDASFYGIRFDGRQTSTGEIFDHKKMTAASNTLPLNTYVKVTNLKNGKWVVVRINDRMHKNNKRLIDLSKRAAKKIGYNKSGITKVTVQYIPKYFYTFFGYSPGELELSSN